MARLLELGILEKRHFPLSFGTARARLNQAAMAGFSKDLLWIISYESEGTVAITAKPTEMPKWKALIEASEAEAARTKNEERKDR